MAVTQIDAQLMKQLFLAGAKNLDTHKEWINELNVFPVPDGDTGTNMTLTIMSAVKEVQNLAAVDMGSLCKAISSGSLRGARGNSGVILSQLFRGFTKELKGKTYIDIPQICACMQKATETAYKAVMKPKEGTILTVAKGMSDKAAELVEKETDLESYMTQILEHGKYVLSQTPEMLPVLKEAGVVDSGGQGLIVVIEGVLDAFCGRTPAVNEEETAAPAKEAAKPADVKGAASDDISTADIKFGYCTEFIINQSREFTEDDEHEFKSYLETLGDCIVVVADDEVVKVHVHTNDPGLAIQKALTYGPLTNMKIDNMRVEHNERVIKGSEELSKKQAEEQTAKAKEPVNEETAKKETGKKEPAKEEGFIAVSIGEGVNDIFRSLNVDYIIEGGQTMNPSTDDMLNAIDQVNANRIYILPNNKNIILAANQAQTLVEDKEIVVVPSKTVPQGIAAMIGFIPGASAQDNLASMSEEMSRIKTGQVTYAVRDTSVNGMEIHVGNIMGIGDSSILAVGTEVEATAKDLLSKMVDDESELICIYYGSDVSESQAEEFAAQITDAYPDVEVELHFGGQPIYYYLMSVE